MSDPRPPDDLGRLAEALTRQAEASRRVADLVESKALPLLERIARALERAPSAAQAGPALPSIAGLRAAVEARDWDLAGAIAAENPDAPELLAVASDLRDRIEAARVANDPEGAMAWRDALARVLFGEPIKEVDRSLAKWLIALIHKRLRSGTIRPDLVGLAGQVADRFGGTAEGASLRAALPTLRRSAGLCPRCGEPYAGLADACPKCLPNAQADPDPDPSPAAEAEGPAPTAPAFDANDELAGEPVDLNDERYWESP